MNQTTQELLTFINGNPTAFHTAASVRERLLAAGFIELQESRPWHPEPGRDYFVSRNGSSILAFRMGSRLESYSFTVAAAHTDSPTFKLKEQPELKTGVYTRLNTEGYGNMICSTWMDRPLSVAGRVLVRRPDGAVAPRLVKLDRDLLVIPSLAIHLNRTVNESSSFNKQVDMLPLFACREGSGSVLSVVAEELGLPLEDILGSDLYLYPRMEATVWGAEEEFLSGPRLDDQLCVYSVLNAFLRTGHRDTITVAAFFDNEEVGSGTRQGAASTFLRDVLRRITASLGGGEEDYLRALASGFMISADNAHAVHPNHPEQSDPGRGVFMNRGVVIKSHAGQKYTSDGMGVALIRELAGRVEVPLQYFANRSDKPSGSTMGNIVMRQAAMRCVDIGLPQLAMHSCYETAGADDFGYMIRLMEEFYGSHFVEQPDGSVRVEK